MASPEPAAQPSLPQEASPAAAEQEVAPQEPAPEAAATAAAPEAEKVGGEEEEEEGECGFCLYMKAGGCKDAFVAWEECVEAAQKEGADMVERCYDATSNLKKCMDAHPDYYAPVLQAEQAVNERAEADAAAAAAEKDKGGEPASGAEKKEEPASDAEKKEETAPQQDAPSSPPAAGEGEKGEAVAQKA